MFGLTRPLHPLISIIKEWPEIDFDFENIKMTRGLYVIGLKGNERGVNYKEGRDMTNRRSWPAATHSAQKHLVNFKNEPHKTRHLVCETRIHYL